MSNDAQARVKKAKMGNDGPSSFFLNRAKNKNSKGGQSHTAGLDFRWWSGRHN